MSVLWFLTAVVVTASAAAAQATEPTAKREPDDQEHHQHFSECRESSKFIPLKLCITVIRSTSHIT